MAVLPAGAQKMVCRDTSITSGAVDGITIFSKPRILRCSFGVVVVKKISKMVPLSSSKALKVRDRLAEVSLVSIS
jgi:hypothetical protein